MLPLLHWVVLLCLAVTILCSPARSEVGGSLLSRMLLDDDLGTPAIAGQCYNRYGAYGGPDGTEWNDNASKKVMNCTSNFPSQIVVYAGNYLSDYQMNSFQAYYSPNDTTSGVHGQQVPTKYEFDISEGEYIVNVTIYYNSNKNTMKVQGIFVNTTLRRSQLMGLNNGSSWSSSFAPGEVLSYFFGAANSFVDSLGIGTSLLTSQ